MTEIVASDGEHNEDEIIFCKLKYLELSGLSSLTSFCTGNQVFNFPSLEIVIVESCFRMKKFSGGFLITPKLRGIRLNKYADKEHWEGNLNETIACQLTNIQVGRHFKVSEFPELWIGKIQGKLLHNVESLTVDTRTFTSNAISAHLLQFLNELRQINVTDSDSLEVVFDLEGLSSDNGHVGLLPRLSELKLMNLPMLRQLWNKHPQGILDFKNLRLLQIENCSSLKYIFTGSMALCLSQLQEMSIYDCPSMKTFFSTLLREQKPKGNGEGGSKDKTRKSSMSLLAISYTLKFPSLEQVTVVECPNLRIFSPGVLSAAKLESVKVKWGKFHWERDLNATIEHLYEKAVAIPSLEELKVEWKTMKDMWPEKFQSVFLSGLKGIELTCYPGGCELLPTDFFQILINLEKLVLRDASFEAKHFMKQTLVSNIPNHVRSLVQLRRMKVEKCEMMQEIVASETDDEEEQICFSQLQYLELHDLPRLTSFCSANPAFNFPSLEDVIIRACPNMKIFAKEVLSTPKVWRVQTGKHKYEWEWEGSLNNTIEALFAHTNAEEIGEASVHMRELQ
ncbi:hypothetical protein GH714_020217 [Hevea brasiliensis]|uniref:Disease resistance protein At4g27190-like leucine-rich repeats domain-containing protein n=1 Tax=Hevea brasiliensis TaxID=3981 RepID=A0A6A6LZ18_HEVBR|nr:hypothetical protein GH714_020217 [Hevea brasiliensis]